MRKMKKPCRNKHPRFCFAPLIVICFGAGLFFSIFCSEHIVAFFAGLCLIILGIYALD